MVVATRTTTAKGCYARRNSEPEAEHADRHPYTPPPAATWGTRRPAKLDVGQRAVRYNRSLRHKGIDVVAHGEEMSATVPIVTLRPPAREQERYPRG